MVLRVDALGRARIMEATRSVAEWLDIPHADLIGSMVSRYITGMAGLRLNRAIVHCVSSKRATIVRQTHPHDAARQGVRWRLAPMADSAGAVRFIEVTILNETPLVARLRAQHVDATRLIATLFQISPAGLGILDERGCFVQINDALARLCGWSRAELVGHSFARLLPASERVAAANWFSGLLRGGGPATTEWPLLRPDGQQGDVGITIGSVTLSDGRSYQMLAMTDYSERRRLEAEVRTLRDRADASVRAKSMFLANMSHELRTPLNAIIGFSEIIKGEVLGPVGTALYSDYASDINLSGQHLLTLVDDVLDMAHIEAGHMDLADSTIDLQRLLIDVHQRYAGRAETARTHLRVEVPDVMPHLRGDERRLRQMLVNLLGNALKFTPSGGTVTVETAIVDKGGFAFVISDTGPGIAVEDLPTAMQSFRHAGTADATRTHNHGPGLGLPLAKAIAEAHGGSLYIDTPPSSAGVAARGTRVIVVLPGSRLVAPSAAGSGASTPFMSAALAGGGVVPAGYQRLSFDVLSPGGLCVRDEVETLDKDGLDALPLGVLLLDRHGRVLRCNATELRFRGLADSQVIGHDFFREIAPEIRVSRLQERFQAGMAEGKLDITLDVVFDLPNRRTKATVGLTMSPRPTQAWLFVRWV